MNDALRKEYGFGETADADASSQHAQAELHEMLTEYGDEAMTAALMHFLTEFPQVFSQLVVLSKKRPRHAEIPHEILLAGCVIQIFAEYIVLTYKLESFKMAKNTTAANLLLRLLQLQPGEFLTVQPLNSIPKSEADISRDFYNALQRLRSVFSGIGLPGDEVIVTKRGTGIQINWNASVQED